MTYQVRKIFLNDPQQRQQVIGLLESDDLHIDSCLDTTYGLFDEADTLAATASAFKNTLRCIAVRKALQGEGLLPPLMSELIADRNEHGFFNLFIYFIFSFGWFCLTLFISSCYFFDFFN
mgnify:CR=1 FL=1